MSIFSIFKRTPTTGASNTLPKKEDLIQKELDRLNSMDSVIRLRALASLEHINDERIVPAFCKVLTNDGSPHVRKRVLEILSSYQDKKLLPYFQKALKDNDSDVREEAARMLWSTSLYDLSSINLFIEALNDSSKYLRKTAVIGLVTLAEHYGSSKDLKGYKIFESLVSLSARESENYVIEELTKAKAKLAKLGLNKI